MSKSPFMKKKQRIFRTSDIYDEVEDSNVEKLETERKNMILDTNDDRNKSFDDENDSRHYFKDYRTTEFDLINKLKESEEYQLQLYNLEQKISVLKNDLHDQTLKNSELEKKLGEYEVLGCDNVKYIENNEINLRKTHELEVLLQKSRKQNLTYADEIKELRRKEMHHQNIIEEIEYLKNENLTLKSFIVSQNKMTHYRHAFDNIKVENYCPKCTESILEASVKCSDSYQMTQSTQYKEEVQVPEVNKPEHRNGVKALKSSSTIQMNNNSDCNENVDKRHSKSQNEAMPVVNKEALRKIMDEIDLPLDKVDSVVRSVIHIGDQVLISVDWNPEKPLKGTVKYIGNLNERYHHRLFIGVKLNVKMNEIPQENRSDGSFRNKRYFTLNTGSGFFLHFSNIVSIYNKETAQFEDFGDYLLRAIDPKMNRNTRKINPINRLHINNG